MSYLPEYKKLHCDDVSLYKNDAIDRFIDTRLSLAKQSNDTTYIESKVGDSESTLSQGEILYLPFKRAAKELNNWILERIAESSDVFFNKKASNITVTRFWMNRMRKGSEVKVHHHDVETKRQGIVAVFYVSATPDSAHLTLVNGGRLWSFLNEYNDDVKFEIPVQSGDLVMHRLKESHGVTEYTGETPRICLVYECSFEF